VSIAEPGRACGGRGLSERSEFRRTEQALPGAAVVTDFWLVSIAEPGRACGGRGLSERSEFRRTEQALPGAAVFTDFRDVVLSPERMSPPALEPAPPPPTPRGALHTPWAPASTVPALAKGPTARARDGPGRRGPRCASRRHRSTTTSI